MTPAEVLAYENPDLLERIMEKESMTEEQARSLYRDLLQFLYVAGTGGGKVFSPTAAIDTAWHHFILFTHDYADFCQRYFGRFIHHVPKTKRRLHLVGDGSLRNAIQTARAVFGPLGQNWTGKHGDGESCVTDCTQCGGHTNCQDK